ncbi:hypothetical protein NM688_g5352 [Phlebia brevispora]|uniref:Uncharacterized protein n=1 Tax=Phlebia brevispora TaxID=194682 RepID=A0ACC1SWS6_9APHY|nr:hypothetical protein NM688_g5352 [Phlebia brevispora]
MDHLQDHPTTLSECSVVCRQWHPRARAHLFRKIRLHTEAQRPSARQKREDFLSFLEHTLTCRPLILELTLEGCSRNPEHYTPLTHCFLQELLHYLPRLQVLRIEHALLEGCSKADCTFHGPRRRELSTFSLPFVHIGSVSSSSYRLHICDIFYYVSRVQTVFLEGTVWNNIPPYVTRRRPPIECDTLWFDVAISKSYRWCRVLPSAANLKCLKLLNDGGTPFTDDDVRRVIRLFTVGLRTAFEQGMFNA